MLKLVISSCKFNQNPSAAAELNPLTHSQFFNITG